MEKDKVKEEPLTTSSSSSSSLPLTVSNPKKRKVDESNPSNPSNVVIHTNSDGESYFKLSESKRLTVRKWKSQILIDIREFYQDKAGEWRPGKKGISLTLDQFRVLNDCMTPVVYHHHDNDNNDNDNDNNDNDNKGSSLSLVDQVIQGMMKDK